MNKTPLWKVLLISIALIILIFAPISSNPILRISILSGTLLMFFARMRWMANYKKWDLPISDKSFNIIYKSIKWVVCFCALFWIIIFSQQWLKEKRLEYWDRAKALAYQYQLAKATPDHSKIVEYKKEGPSTITKRLDIQRSSLIDFSAALGASAKGIYQVSITGDNESTESNLHGPGHQTGIFVKKGDNVAVRYISGKISFNCYGDSGPIWGYSNLRGMKKGETMRYQRSGLGNAVIPILRTSGKESIFPFREGSIQTSTTNPYDKAEIILFYNGKERYFSKLAGKFRDDGFLAAGVDGSRAEFIIEIFN